MGYDDSFDFYLGKSMYNESLIGWNGHNEDDSIALLDQLRVQLQKNIGEIKNGGLKKMNLLL